MQDMKNYKFTINTNADRSREYARLEKLNEQQLLFLLDRAQNDQQGCFARSRLMRNLMIFKIEDILHTRSAA